MICIDSFLLPCGKELFLIFFRSGPMSASEVSLDLPFFFSYTEFRNHTGGAYALHEKNRQ